MSGGRLKATGTQKERHASSVSFFLVDLEGFEPLTSAMRTQRSRKVVSFLPMDCGVWFDKNIGRVDIILHLTGISREIEFVPDRD